MEIIEPKFVLKNSNNSKLSSKNVFYNNFDGSSDDLSEVSNITSFNQNHINLTNRFIDEVKHLARSDSEGTLVNPEFDFCDTDLDESDENYSTCSVLDTRESKLRKSFCKSRICNEEHMDENLEPKEEQLDDGTSYGPQLINNESIMLICIISIGSYIIGYFGFTFIWIILMLYQSVVWYMNMTQDLTERVRWEIKREMASNQRATYIESFEIGQIAPRIENIKILPRRENDDDEDMVIGEATISFRARSSGKPQDAPPHILAWIKTGISAIVPLKVELIGFVASIHFEIKITGSSPFVSTGKFSFLNFPTYETSIMPLIPMNVAQFPLMKQFIRNAVQMVLEGFTYPKFVAMDLAELLTGDGLVHDTQAIGIMRVDVIQARDLAKMDVSELDIVDEHIKFKLNVMDWDRFTPDDPIGAVWIDIKDAIGNGEHEVKIFDSWSDLHMKPNDRETRGKLRFRLKYYPKLPNGVEPSPDQTSGILGLKIHQAMSLQVTAAPYNKKSEVVMPATQLLWEIPSR
ncbi:7265_t:CDS:10 [Acaulospora colombiana]|uniref:7265_t:CDS:1 n=1 Tax=Acaulospora colombiana TaxID=27376 RepID=A0ACA9KK26_9GLOM|nr:7265_t:CDS:10 [Acaulospora colombiana]